ncbi:hypothetical protein [Coleofasciculus sp. H7-2]|uniref:hypothetical protein n=1 Tax=Coleofasciculus sp. H7-2 TaxID=3351545 RepID=UPI0036731F6A
MKFTGALRYRFTPLAATQANPSLNPKKFLKSKGEPTGRRFAIARILLSIADANYLSRALACSLMLSFCLIAD